jgi:glyoxylase-like metal-dependent hydrolase (beta-lactamase superfamily II)
LSRRAAAVPAVPAVRLLRTFAASPLPKPNPLPTEIAVPSASPPEDMDLIAVPTGVNKRVAAYGYRGGSFLDKRDFNIGAALIKHPKGDLLVDTGFGRDIDQQFATMPRFFQKLTKYELWKPARDQLEAAGYDFDRLGGILLTHAHWDHVSGLPDFPGVPVLVSKRDKVAFNKPGMRGYFGPPFNQFHFNWHEFDFEAGPYLGFPRSHDVYGDGSIVCVPAPGHTPGSIIVFVTLPNNVRYALVGDLVWQREGLTNLEERPLLSRLWADLDPDGTRQNILRMASIVKRIPNMIVVPAHDQRAFADMAELPNVTTKGLIL